MVAPRRPGVRDLSRSTILRQDLLRKTLVPPLVPARGALVACLTGLVTLTSTCIYVLHYSTYTHVPGSVSIHSLRTVVLDYGELLAYWFTLHDVTLLGVPWYLYRYLPTCLLFIKVLLLPTQQWVLPLLVTQIKLCRVSTNDSRHTILYLQRANKEAGTSYFLCICSTAATIFRVTHIRY
jgi:hypothetical protein